jgi:hypothetical protein
MFGLMVMLALGALVVDVLRIERIGRSLQRASDSAALAASLHLRGDPYTPNPNAAVQWKQAKRAAVMALRNNLIAEDMNLLADGATWTPAGIMDFWDSSPVSPYTGSEINIGRLRFTIERGAWLYNEDGNGGSDTDGASSEGPYFVPLESTDGGCPEIWSEENYRRANAARVRIEITSWRSAFPLAWAGNAEVGGLAREAVASVQPSGP